MWWSLEYPVYDYVKQSSCAICLVIAKEKFQVPASVGLFGDNKSAGFFAVVSLLYN